MDTIRFQCSGCGKGLSAPADRADKTGNCPGCGTPITITIPVPAPQTEQTQGADKIKFACSQCSKVVTATPDKAGKTAKCPACGFTLQIPQTRDYYKQSLVAAVDALLKSIELRGQGDGQQALKCVEAAEQAARELLASPCLAWLPAAYEITALNVLGTCGWHLMDDRYDPSAVHARGDRHERNGKLAEAQAALEKALALGRSKGYTGQEVEIADILCRIYGLAVLRAAGGDHLDKAAAIASRLDDLVRCHRDAEGFESQEHGSALLMANAMIDAMTAEQQCDYENALVLYNNLLESPYMKCSGSGTTLRWLVWTAYMRIGRILFLYEWRVQDAIPYLQNAVRYSDKDDAQLQEARSLLEDAMSQPLIPPQLKSTLDAVRSGDDTARHKAFQELQGGVPRQYLRAVQSAVFQAMREGDNVVQSRGALVLATMGDASAFTVKRLLLNLTPPPSENELAYKSEALFGLSHIKNGSDIIVKEILGVAQHDKDAVARERAVFALAVIGDNGAREFVRRLAVAGNDTALFALEWLRKDVGWLRTAVLCGRAELPSEPILSPEPTQTAQAAAPQPPTDTESGRLIATTKANVQAMKLRLFWTDSRRACLQLYCPLRSQRETLSSETWFLLGILPPAVMFLLGLVLILTGAQFLTGAAIALIFTTFVHVVSYLYVSFLGPSGQHAKQALAAISAQRETLRAEMAAAQQKHDDLCAPTLAQQANAVVQAAIVVPAAKAHAAGASLWHGAEEILGLTDVDWVESVAFSPDGQHLVSGSQDNSMRVWNAWTGQNMSTFRGHTGKIGCVAFSPDGRLLASGSDDTTLRIWNAGGQRIHCLSHRRWCWSGHVGSLAFSPDGQRLVTGSTDWALRLWNVQTGARMLVLKGHCHTVDAVAFSPNGQLLASGAGDGTVRIWNSGTGQAILTLKADAKAVKGVCFSPDGQIIACAGFDNTLKLWDVRTGQHILTLAGHTNWVYGVAFSPDGQHLVSGSRDTTVKLWDVGTGREILSLDADGWIFSVAFSPDGQRVVSGGQGGIKMWRTT